MRKIPFHGTAAGFILGMKNLYMWIYDLLHLHRAVPRPEGNRAVTTGPSFPVRKSNTSASHRALPDSAITHTAGRRGRGVPHTPPHSGRSEPR